ncbi:GDSL family lipase [Verrucomicrobiaceae bacterium 5K15]|uniref:GDSL family lipase n=1 Tax=Oceaniferula flava TaxID=2800421 RepID=A0AAE2VD22_9BACT|nr:platelet-activating factor acetylhydrolase IB subunit [Oceaniferula flavus]MBK1854024.1 GDSL family lipase [Oceaniferula flavus]MBM1135330.1 GDSL family lipase [Oceaniferula flavus]
MILKSTLVAAMFCSSLVQLHAQAPAAPTQEAEANSATTPADKLKSAWWKKRHEQKVAAAKKAKVDLLFIGDSITHAWERGGAKIWKEYYAPRNAFNIGFSGDRTQNVLWRLDNGEMAGMKPKVAIIMIGTNNTGHSMQKAEETAAGIKAIIDRVHQQNPKTKVLLLAIFPRGAQPDHKMRVLNDKVNEIIKGYAEDERITYLDLAPSFLEDDGVLSKKVMPDLLHPRAHGYQIWAEAMEPTLKTLLEEK